MSKINYRRRDTWKIKFRKPISIRPAKVMDDVKYTRHRAKERLHELLLEIKDEDYCKPEDNQI